MKQCLKCGCEKPLDAFYAHPGYSDGLQEKCKECAKVAARAHRAANPLKVQAYERRRGQLPHRKEAVRERAPKYKDRQLGYLQKRRAKSHEKYTARTAVGNAIRDGRLKREGCEVCGTEKAHAHHEDYSAPLEVKWLCAEHHNALHREERSRLLDLGTRQAV